MYTEAPGLDLFGGEAMKVIKVKRRHGQRREWAQQD